MDVDLTTVLIAAIGSGATLYAVRVGNRHTQRLAAEQRADEREERRQEQERSDAEQRAATMVAARLLDHGLNVCRLQVKVAANEGVWPPDEALGVPSWFQVREALANPRFGLSGDDWGTVRWAVGALGVLRDRMRIWRAEEDAPQPDGIELMQKQVTMLEMAESVLQRLTGETGRRSV